MVDVKMINYLVGIRVWYDSQPVLSCWIRFWICYSHGGCCLGGIRVWYDSQPGLSCWIRLWICYSHGCCCLGGIRVRWDSQKMIGNVATWLLVKERDFKWHYGSWRMEGLVRRFYKFMEMWIQISRMLEGILSEILVAYFLLFAF